MEGVKATPSLLLAPRVPALGHPLGNWGTIIQRNIRFDESQFDMITLIVQEIQ